MLHFISLRNNWLFRVSGVRKNYWMDLHPHMSSLKAVVNDTNLKEQPSNMRVCELLTKSCTFHEHGLDLRLHFVCVAQTEKYFPAQTLPQTGCLPRILLWQWYGDLVCWSPTEQVPDSSTVHKYIFSWSQRNMVLAIKKLMLTHKNIFFYTANFTISRWVIIYVFPTITPISDQVALCRLAVSQTRPCDAVNEGIKLC